MRPKEQVVLVTGGSAGLGKAICNQLHSEGFLVYGTSRNPSNYQTAYPLLQMDVTHTESVNSAIRELVKKEGRIDVLINNAGIGIAGPTEQLSLENIERAYQTNVYGPIRTIQAVLPQMRQQNGGKIINISTIGSVVGLPFRSIYCATKASLDMITEALRMEIKPFGIQATCIRAGDIRTNIGAARIMEYKPEDPAYKQTYETVAEGIDADVDHGTSPEKMAQYIIRIMKKNSLKRVYSAGKPLQRLSIPLKSILPGKVFERIILKFSGL